MRFNNLVTALMEQNTAPSISERDRDIVAALLIGEAGGEKDYVAGMGAVMNVIVNRAKNNPAKFVAVVTQPQQFSAFNNIKTSADMDKAIAKAKLHPNFKTARSLVDSAARKSLPSVVGPSTHYYANLGAQKIAAPRWSKKGTPTAQVGSHKFLTNIPYRTVK